MGSIHKKIFGMPMSDQDKPWAPHVICGTCRTILAGWLQGKKIAMPFAVPRVWREQKNHHDDCYFCMIDITKYRKAKGRQALPLAFLYFVISIIHDYNVYVFVLFMSMFYCYLCLCFTVIYVYVLLLFMSMLKL